MAATACGSSPRRSTRGLDSVGAGDQPEIGVDHLGRRVAAVVEKFLPLAHHAQEGVVEQDDLHADVRLENRRQFLNGHLQPAVAREEDDLAVGSAQLGADGGREAEPHGSQTARRDDAAAAAEPEVAGGEHLLLPHVGDHHRVAVVGACHGVDRLAHADAPSVGTDRPPHHTLVLDAVAGAELLDPCAVVARADAFGQQRERTLDVAHEGHVGMDDFVDFGGVDLHMDDPGVGAEGGGVARYAVRRNAFRRRRARSHSLFLMLGP